MPIPKPNEGEKESEFVSRCIEQLSKTDPSRPQKQVVAICYSEFKRHTTTKASEKLATQEGEIFKIVPIKEDRGNIYNAPNGNYKLNPLGLGN